jgi:hypothetical protein
MLCNGSRWLFLIYMYLVLIIQPIQTFTPSPLTSNMIARLENYLKGCKPPITFDHLEKKWMKWWDRIKEDLSLRITSTLR